MLAAEGEPIERIMSILGKPRRAVKRIIGSKLGKQRIDQIRGELILAEVKQKYGLARLLPKARTVLEEALYQGDSRTRPKVAQWLHEAVISKPAVKNELKIQGVIQHDLAPLFEQMGDHLRALREANSSRDPLARVKVGTASLVRQMLPEKAGE